MKKTQVRFVVLTMTCLFVILAVLVATLNITSYVTLVKHADSVLDILAENGGTFPETEIEDSASLDRAAPAAPPESDDNPPKGSGRKTRDDEKKDSAPARTANFFYSPELPHESRFFSVLLDSAGNILETQTDRISAIDDSTAETLALKILGRDSERGFEGVYRYLNIQVSGNHRIIFLDTSATFRSFYSTLFYSVVIALTLLVVVFLVVAFFSNRILRPIAESYEKQKQFITDAGHEIKTPLTIIRADADVLEMELGQNEWLEDIQRQTSRLSELTQNLLLLSRMEENRSTLTMIDFPISDIVSETAAGFVALAKTRNRELIISVEPMLSLCGDEKAISNLVSILLDNAMKYSPGGSTIHLWLNRSGRNMTLTVRNRIPKPIAKDALPRLFERFYRIDPARNSDVGGHGIGLSMARAIVTAHGGKIQAITPEDNLIEFTVTLPM